MTPHQEAVATVAVYLCLLGAVMFVSGVSWGIIMIKQVINRINKILGYVEEIESKDRFTID